MPVRRDDVADGTVCRKIAGAVGVFLGGAPREIGRLGRQGRVKYRREFRSA